MSKRNIAYIKPQDPSFLAKLKAEIGYKEGPSVDTKRQKLHDDGGDSNSEGEGVDRPERDDEQPQVVVLQAGDLTKEQVELEQKRIAKAEAEAPADLNQRIIFKKKSKDNKKDFDTKSSTSKSTTGKKQQQSNCSKLSFTEGDEEEGEEEK